MKQFDVPNFYRSPLITAIKTKRKEKDKMKKDFAPSLVDFGPLQFYLARHFGFCYGVENAIEIAFKTIKENPDKKIFLLSEMIHNPQVNADLEKEGVKFLQDTHGRTIIPFDGLTKNDIVLIPAFGTTIEIESRLSGLGIQTEKYNTTCPFVEKVWNKSELIGKQQYTVVIHGKPTHEETRATFSHASLHSPAVIVSDMVQAQQLTAFMTGEKPAELFYKEFDGQYSAEFNVKNDLQRIGVVNQTTMLATETQAIADLLKQTIAAKYHNDENVTNNFADTRDTLCYATNDNQQSVIEMLNTVADLAIVVGGYNSSNTSHLVELCEKQLPTFFISDQEKILSATDILHYNIHEKKEMLTPGFLNGHTPIRILLTSGASCPDATVEAVIDKIAGYYHTPEEVSRLKEASVGMIESA